MNYTVCSHLNLASLVFVRFTCVIACASSVLIQRPEHFLVCILLSVWNVILAIGDGALWWIWSMTCSPKECFALSCQVFRRLGNSFDPVTLSFIISLGSSIFILNLVLGQGPYSSRMWFLYWGMALTSPLASSSSSTPRQTPLLPPWPPV